jgi:hypothetical protein
MKIIYGVDEPFVTCSPSECQWLLAALVYRWLYLAQTNGKIGEPLSVEEGNVL